MRAGVWGKMWAALMDSRLVGKKAEKMVGMWGSKMVEKKAGGMVERLENDKVVDWVELKDCAKADSLACEKVAWKVA